ncbi:MAG TPA: trypsin-like serine protease [Polyangiaceae bacterium]|nr:trypsin-like serine protease [Polyangiaceae bacterium]
MDLGQSSQAIVSGTNATNASLFPQTLVQYSGGCSGTIISPRHVLTASHCAPAKGDTVTFYNNGFPTALKATVVNVYEAANLHSDPTTGAPVDSVGNIADWAVVTLGSTIPAGYSPARVSSVELAMGASVYEAGVGTHDGVTPFGTVMRWRAAHTRAETSNCPLPQPAAPQWCRGSVFADPYGNPGDSGSGLFTYTNPSTNSGPLVVHGGMLTGDARYTSTATHFMKLMTATGLTQQNGTMLGGTSEGSPTFTVSAQECASLCRLDSNCQGYAFTNSNSVCSLMSVPGVGLPGSTGVFGVKGPTGPCSPNDAICRIDLDPVESISPPIAIGPTGHGLDYFQCASEKGTCTVGGNKYVAYGANGSYVYMDASGAIPCTTTYFGVDPAPGVVKSCYFANYAYESPEGGSFTWHGNVAYGANGVFNFIQANGSVACNNSTFGDPTPGTAKNCYLALGDYTLSASENGTMPNGFRQPVAYGANGKFVYGVLTGTASCSNTTFGTDPAPGVVKACYALAAPFLTDERQNFALSSSAVVRYGSGFNGNFLTTYAASGACTSTAFQGDPHFGAVKHCYGP